LLLLKVKTPECYRDSIAVGNIEEGLIWTRHYYIMVRPPSTSKE